MCHRKHLKQSHLRNSCGFLNFSSEASLGPGEKGVGVKLQESNIPNFQKFHMRGLTISRKEYKSCIKI